MAAAVKNKRKNMTKTAVLASAVLVAAFVLWPNALHAQTRTPQQNAEYRLAQSYERMGMYENAARRYRRLFDSEPANASFYNALKRTLERLNQYDELIAVVEKRLQAVDDVVGRADLGSALYRAGREKEARTVWAELLKKYGKTSGAYAQVASSMLRNGLFDDAVATYRRARKDLDNGYLFAVELANAFAGRGNYLAAAKELLLYLERRPMQLGYVRSRIMSFLQEDAGVLAVVEQKVKSSAKPGYELLSLLGECLMQQKKYARALEVMQALEQAKSEKIKKQTAGRELYSLAEKALRDSSYAVAEQAYTLILETWPKSRYATASRLGRIKSWIAAGNYERGLADLDIILQENKKNTLALEAIKLKGALLLDEFDDAEEAFVTYRMLFRDFSSRATRKFAARKLGTAALRLSRYAEAESWLRQALALTAEGETAEKNAILFDLAALELCRGEFQKALQQFNAILPDESNGAEDAASQVNDALDLALIIEENLADSTTALAGYAAYLCAMQKEDVNSAKQTLEDWLASFSGSTLAPRVMLELAALYHRTREFTKEITLLENVVESFAETVYADEALFRLGSVYAQTGHAVRAIERFEQLLIEYPYSTYLELARKSIRRLSEEIK